MQFFFGFRKETNRCGTRLEDPNILSPAKKKIDEFLRDYKSKQTRSVQRFNESIVLSQDQLKVMDILNKQIQNIKIKMKELPI